jgi:hypothetical protein
MARPSSRQKNQKLIDARLRLTSASGEPWTPQDVADAMNTFLWAQYQKECRKAKRPRKPTILDHRFVSGYESGRHRWPTMQYRAAFLHALRVETDAELGFTPKRRPRFEPYMQVPDTAATAPTDVVESAGEVFGDVLGTAVEPERGPQCRPRPRLADMLPESPAADSADAVIVNLVINGRQQALRLSRRGLFEAFTGSLMAPLLGGTEEIRGPVDPAVVDHFAALRAVLVESDNQLGAATILPTVRHQLGLIARFRRNAKGTLHDQLLGTEARWAEFAGWLCDDLGEHAEGGWWLSEATSMALESHDTDFSTYVLARKAQRASRGADQDRVLGLAQAALRVGTAYPRVAAFAALQQAHGHALAGDTREFESAIGKAQTLADGKTTSDGELGSFCTRPYVVAQEAEGWLHLRQPGKAASRFSQALDGWPAPHQRDRGLYLSRAAVAQLANEQHEEAATTALTALRLADTTHSMRIRKEVEAVGRRLARFEHRPAVAALLSALSTGPAEVH